MRHEYVMTVDNSVSGTRISALPLRLWDALITPGASAGLPLGLDAGHDAHAGARLSCFRSGRVHSLGKVVSLDPPLSMVLAHQPQHDPDSLVRVTLGVEPCEGGSRLVLEHEPYFGDCTGFRGADLLHLIEESLLAKLAHGAGLAPGAVNGGVPRNSANAGVGADDDAAYAQPENTGPPPSSGSAGPPAAGPAALIR